MVGGDVGPRVGVSVGDIVGPNVGERVGDSVGDSVGGTVGDAVGDCVGTTEGLCVGVVEGVSVGANVGATEGFTVGAKVQTSPTQDVPSQSQHSSILHCCWLDPAAEHSKHLEKANPHPSGPWHAVFDSPGHAAGDVVGDADGPGAGPRSSLGASAWWPCRGPSRRLLGGFHPNGATGLLLEKPTAGLECAFCTCRAYINGFFGGPVPFLDSEHPIWY